MAKKNEFRFSIGGQEEKRSNIWKIIISNSDIYITTRGMGADYKISLHESGQCQSSLTSEFIKKTSMENSTRHKDKWLIPEMGASQASIILKLIFTSDGLIELNNNEKNISLNCNSKLN